MEDQAGGNGRLLLEYLDDLLSDFEHFNKQSLVANVVRFQPLDALYDFEQLVDRVYLLHQSAADGRLRLSEDLESDLKLAVKSALKIVVNLLSMTSAKIIEKLPHLLDTLL